MAIRLSWIFFFLFGHILLVSTAPASEEAQNAKSTNGNDGGANAERSQDTGAKSQSQDLNRKTNSSVSGQTSKSTSYMTRSHHSAEMTNIEDENGQQLVYDSDGIHIRMRSPKARIDVDVRGNEVYVNNRLVCNDASKLTEDLTYQKSDDGAFWHTNLKVGKPMTKEEIGVFEKDFKLSGELANETAKKWQKWAEEREKFWQSWSEEFKKDFDFERNSLFSDLFPKKDNNTAQIQKGNQSQSGEVKKSAAQSTSYNITQSHHSAYMTNIEDENGQQMVYDCGGIYIRMRSPKTKQDVYLRGKKVFVNDRLVCSDASKLTNELTYQKCDDGALWHTNLKVGKPMTKEEIAAFEKEFKLSSEKRKTDKRTDFWVQRLFGSPRVTH